jgi:hypothetical protein
LQAGADGIVHPRNLVPGMQVSNIILSRCILLRFPAARFRTGCAARFLFAFLPLRLPAGERRGETKQTEMIDER